MSLCKDALSGEGKPYMITLMCISSQCISALSVGEAQVEMKAGSKRRAVSLDGPTQLGIPELR